MNALGEGKIKYVVQSHVDKNTMPLIPSDTKKRTIGKTDNVKTSPHRQVKAQAFHILLRSSLLFLSFLLQNVNAAAEVDLIFVNGNIYTANERQPHAEAIGVKKDRVVFIGANADAKKLAGEETRVVDLGGKTVVPGLTDSHCHIFGIGEREMTLNLERTNTREDFLANVKERVAQTGRAANGSPVAAGSKLFGNRRGSRPGMTWMKLRRTIPYFSRAPTVMPPSRTAPR
jgi:hypothetical protein